MRTFLALVVLAVPVVAAPVPKVKKQNDATLVLGRWVIESATQGQSTYDHQKGDIWVFAPPDEKSIQLTKSGTTYSLTYSFPAPSEKQMDVACNGNPYLGVYELDGDTLTIAFRAKDRPTTVEKANGVFVFHFRRVIDTPAK